jgi:hypothetical protein
VINNWQSRFGAKRRAIDRKLLLEVEREITAQDLAWIERQANRGPHLAVETEIPITAELRANIARAFGRPIK